MAADDQEGAVDFDEGRLWLPSRVLDEPHVAKAHLRSLQKHRHHAHHRVGLPPESFPMCEQHSKSSSRTQQRPKMVQNWASGGPGMQAIFLESGKKSCGTGVFLPQRAGINFPQTKKTACAPVLLPNRVVQALNLNVHKLGLQVSPRKDPKSSRKGGDSISVVKNKKGKDVPSSQCCVVSQNASSSPELFLPKEWTY